MSLQLLPSCIIWLSSISLFFEVLSNLFDFSNTGKWFHIMVYVCILPYIDVLFLVTERDSESMKYIPLLSGIAESNPEILGG